MFLLCPMAVLYPPLPSSPTELPMTQQPSIFLWKEISMLFLWFLMSWSPSRFLLLGLYSGIPPFYSSLFYDPSIGLAKLLGGEGGGGGRDDSFYNDEALIIAVFVGGSVALLFVFGVGLLVLLGARWNQKTLV